MSTVVVVVAAIVMGLSFTLLMVLAFVDVQDDDSSLQMPRPGRYDPSRGSEGGRAA